MKLLDPIPFFNFWADKMSKPKPQTRQMFSKVYGIAADKKRQKVAKKLSAGQQLICQPEPSNPVAPNALALLSPKGKQVGYVNADLAEEFSKKMANGWQYLFEVKEVTGGGKQAIGCNLIITIIPPGAVPSGKSFMGQLKTAFFIMVFGAVGLMLLLYFLNIL